MRPVRLPPIWTVLALLGACVDKTPFALVKNTCVTNAQCVEIGTVCDTEYQQCMRETVEEPYQVILQVRPKPGSVELPEGESLVEQETYAAFELQGAIKHKALEVPLSQQVIGRVVRRGEEVEGEEQLVEAQVSFEPEDETLPSPDPFETRRIPGDDENNLTVRLNPNVRYRVHVQPLSEDSRTIGPFTDSYDGSGKLEIVVPKMARRAGVLRIERWGDERDAILGEHRIRLEDKSGGILSSTDTTGPNGEFELFAPEKVMDEQPFNVVVSLKPFSLWSVKVAVDGSRLALPDGVVLTIPRAPALVKYEGGVELKKSDDEGAREPAPFAEMLFSSRFPVPTDGTNPGGKNWCAWRSAAPGPAPLCSAQIATRCDANGKFSAELLPGDYDVFISPGTETSNSTALGTIKWGANVLSTSEEDPTRSGLRYELRRAIHFEGLVRSPNGEAMPNVKVSATPLAIPGPTAETEVYKYARPAAAITTRGGTFELDVDRGYFDLTVETPSESGFAWMHSLNRVVRSQPEHPVGPLQPRVPVPVSGQVQHEGMPLPGATVEAFALITGDPGGRRAVRIAQTVTDEDGNYRLALPPAVRARDVEDAGVGAAADAQLDAGHSE